MQELVAFIYNCYAILTRLQLIQNQFILKEEKRLPTGFNAIPLSVRKSVIPKYYWLFLNQF